MLFVGFIYGIGVLKGLSATDDRYQACEKNNSYVAGGASKVYLYYDIDDPTKTYIYENDTYVEYYFNATENTYYRVNKTNEIPTKS